MNSDPRPSNALQTISRVLESIQWESGSQRRDPGTGVMWSTFLVTRAAASNRTWKYKVNMAKKNKQNKPKRGQCCLVCLDLRNIWMKALLWPKLVIYNRHYRLTGVQSQWTDADPLTSGTAVFSLQGLQPSNWRHPAKTGSIYEDVRWICEELWPSHGPG